MYRFVSLSLILSFAIGGFAGAATFEHAGAGGGGMLHAGAFHPDTTYVGTMVVGADVSGVYRTDDFGASWYPWNEGLQNDYEASSFYVDDLVGVDYGEFTGWFAATHGGLWSAQDTGPWVCETPGDEFYYSVSKWGGTVSYAMPFSCLGWNGANILVAGAGRNRYFNYAAYEPSAYPGLDPAGIVGSSHGTGQYTVWTLDLDETDPVWRPDTTAIFGTARDIAVVDVEVSGQTTTYTVVTTANGVFLHDGTQWIDLTGSLIFSPSGSAAISETPMSPWDVEITSRGTVYVALNNLESVGGTHPNGIYRMHDARNPGARFFKWLGDTQTLIAPNNETMNYIFHPVRSIRMPFLTVKEGAAAEPDRVFAATVSGWLHPGLYIGDAPYDWAPDVAWQHRVYDGIGIVRKYRDSNGVESQINDHWQTIWGGVPHFEPLVSAHATPRIFLDLNAMYVVSDDGGENWYQNGAVGTGGAWATTGYSELCIRGLAFDSEGRLIEAPGDVGAFVSTDSTLSAFSWITPGMDKYTTSTSDLAWTNQTDGVVVRENWQGSGNDSYFILYGDAWGSGGRASKLFRYDGSWQNITASIPNLDRYKFFRCGFYDDSTCFLSYQKYDARFDVSSRKLVEIGVLRGTYSGGAWTWTAINDGLAFTDGVNTMNVYGTDFLYSEITGSLYMSAQNLVVSPTTCAVVNDWLDIKGAIYALDDPAGANPTWRHVFGGATSDYKDFRCLAQSRDGSILYAGTRGRATGRGSVLILEYPASDDTDWEPMINTAATGYPFDFHPPLGMTWDQDRANRVLTDVRSIVVNPWNSRTIYVGLWSEGMHEQRGVWEYRPRYGWSNMSVDAPFCGITVVAQAIDVRVEAGTEFAILAVGTGGLETWYTTLTNPTGGGGGDPEDPPVQMRISQRSTRAGLSVFSFGLQRPSSAEIGIYDVRGRLVRKLSTQVLPAGEHSVQWDNRDARGARVASGVYLARILAGDSSATAKFVLVK